MRDLHARHKDERSAKRRDHGCGGISVGFRGLEM
jgi:hypothetical protein